MISQNSFSKLMETAEVMLKGIQTQKDLLAGRGIDDAYIEKFKGVYQSCLDTNNLQEKAKADMAKLTETLNNNVLELKKEIQFVKRSVMTEIPKAGWREFGMIYRYRGPKNNSETPAEEENPVASG